MPEPIQIIISSKNYTVPILNGEMDNLVQEIEVNKERLREAREELRRASDKIETFSRDLLLLYIRDTGEYPPE